jgi:hypothetical protein
MRQSAVSLRKPKLLVRHGDGGEDETSPHSEAARPTSENREAMAGFRLLRTSP